MKTFANTVALLALWLTMATLPMAAQTLYSNGPTNGNAWAWGINFAGIASNTFNVANDSSTISGANFAMWLYPGDVLDSAELLITSAKFGGGTIYFDQVVTFTYDDCIESNEYGFTVCQDSTAFNGPELNLGTYWVTLRHATTYYGNPVYWDQNYGPAQAVQCCEKSAPPPNSIGTIPSESFTILGNYTSTFVTETRPVPR